MKFLQSSRNKNPETRLSEIIAGKEGNYLLPFYWQHGNHFEYIPEQIERIRTSGAKAFCVESRPHPDFCGLTWWRDMDAILSEARKRDMKVWIFDDNHFPTGNANGAIKEKFPELRKWYLIERHLDVIGVMNEAAVLLRPADRDSILLGAFAYARTGVDEDITGEPIDITAHIKGSYLYWNIPEGCYRIFFLYKSRLGFLPKHEFYIDMLRRESVAVLIDAVYEPHYKHYKKYFGNTLAGFFSDEPYLGNGWIDTYNHIDQGVYDRRVGMPGLAMPWCDEIPVLMAETIGGDILSRLPLLWYRREDCSREIRYAYMEAVTKQYRDCFTRNLGNWCRSRGVEYIGHVIEDMNSHARLGYGTGHYFRSIDGQDMSGIDIACHQVMPGFAHYSHTASSWGKAMDSEFTHYILAQLAASAAHFNPLYQRRALCEVFGAYGWGAGTPMLKWLIDFLLVRGINHFIPHAFSPEYPDPDCPPHFGAEGHDPQFGAFTKLMIYTNKISHLLTGTIHHANAAILYHAEAEWCNSNGEYMLMQKPAKVLYDNQICYDIIPLDTLVNAVVKAGKLVLNQECYDCLIIPFARYLPQQAVVILERLQTRGLKIWFIDGKTENFSLKAAIVPLEKLAEEMIIDGMVDIKVQGNYPFLRYYHASQDACDIYMFVNESVTEPVDTMVTLPAGNYFLKLDFLNDKINREKTDEKNRLKLNLAPYQSGVYVSTKNDKFWSNYSHDMYPLFGSGIPIKPEFKVEIADSGDLSAFRLYCETDSLFNITAPEHLPDFSGLIRYTGKFEYEGKYAVCLDLGMVGQSSKVILNDHDLGYRICPPYRYEITNMLKQGTNTLVIIVANTLANKEKDYFSSFLQLPPSGMLGPLTVWRLGN
ncbi:MAG: hypothetical protein PHH77_07905 [Victivallaceae bacterium]|nr:hypothetical protein [Victivallaceae bacterium]